VEYDGTNFVGWQRQLNGRSVQQAIEESLKKYLNTSIVITGAGRTDAGVHATGQVFHFDIDKELRNEEIKDALNFHLKDELISILDASKVDNNFDARRSAKKRTYKYSILNRDSPPSISKNKAWYIKKKLNENSMKDALTVLIGTFDFSTFRSASCGATSPIRTIDNILMYQNGEMIDFKFISQSFLQQQVRSMMGCIKYVGEEKWNKEKLKMVLESKNRSNCAPPAPSHGLYLEKVEY
jgi:tRNA pseudouridine38-40 synthase